ncbi:GNAT family N-acetyltransferase [Natronosporangium hydrolyticum]|uniref:GNAT family N-acetyltransferase n=1 Tax=Natronosporangium hydrolyticum TaxID=2811111 RepID=A0A895YPL9_9ACTN|nr:GNAT family N-acetyltransferase [Natronosporangium hydrolyticum]QSB16060.1 GNAT family N-acetyltransferase [Natronosporangium hydrolyticum]
MTLPGSLPELVHRIESGDRLPAHPWLSVLPAAGTPVVLAFPGHAVVATGLDPEWVRGQLLPDADLSAPLNPPFLSACEQQLGRRVNNLDGLYLASPLAGPPAESLRLREVTDSAHPRVRRARRTRPELRIWHTDEGVLIVGRGLAGRWEAAVEVPPHARARGLGRGLARAARQLVPAGRPVWAQIAPGNAASVRAFLAAGYRPVGAEALFTGPAVGGSAGPAGRL